jgi:hypothetical protein
VGSTASPTSGSRRRFAVFPASRAGRRWCTWRLPISAGWPRARWNDVVLALFVGAGLTLIGSVQAGFWARRYLVTPQDLAGWYPAQISQDQPNDWMRTVQQDHAGRCRRWTDRTRRMYNAGITLLVAGVAVVMVPSGSIAGTRWIPIAVAAAGLGVELCWLVVVSRVR